MSLMTGQLALRWVNGAQPQTVIEEATWYRSTQSLAEATDPAATLTWRIAVTKPHRPTGIHPWPGCPTSHPCYDTSLA
ncbi:hypothetical protein K0651_06000 [Ornithinimicrobium sp. Arc0846-15]|nr:hypothetical protein [Ornithinimicrobium laminariae]